MRTLLDPQTPSYSDRPPRRTALIAAELKRYNIDIAALSETRLAEEDSISEAGEGYSFFWRGLPKDEHRIHGVGFAIKTTLLKDLPENPIGINERIMTLRIPLTCSRYATLVSIYAPTLTSPEEVKDQFYDELTRTLNSISRHDKLILLGDFNARVGNNHDVWSGVIGRHGLGKINANGLRLLNLCATYNLSITNTFFQLKSKHKTTWMHPRSHHWHLIDFIITRKSDLQDFRITKSMRGAECWTDHRLLRSLVRFKIRPPARKQKKKRDFDRSKFHDPQKVEELQSSLAETLNHLLIPVQPPSTNQEINNLWTPFTNTLHETTRNIIGYSQKRHQDWFDQNNQQIHDLLDKKNKAHQAAINNPKSQAARDRFQELRSESQRTLRTLQNDWWFNKATEIQGYADTNDHQHFYSAIKSAYGPIRTACAPLRSADDTNLIKDAPSILERWTEYLTGLLNHRNPIDPTYFEDLPTLPVINQLDETPTYEDIRKACLSLKNNKAPGPDGLPGELFKYGGPALTEKLHDFISLFWTTGLLPQTWKDPIMTMIYKRKGCRTRCENYRGISLLDVAGKILARVMLTRLINSPIMEVLPETQCGFRKDRSTSDMMFVARQIQEKCREQHRDLYIAFVDLAKAFDTVNRDMLWTVLAKFGCPPRFMTILRAFHEGMSARVSVGGILSNSFEVTVGVKQGCVLAPVIFNIYMAAITFLARRDMNAEQGITYRYRLDGSLFNLRRLKARTRTHADTIFDLQYADDAGYPTNNPQAMQTNLNTIHSAYSKGGLAVNTEKTVILPQANIIPAEDNNLPSFRVGDVQLKNVSSEKYLGSILSSDCSLENEIQNRIRLASSSFGRLNERVFQNRDLSITTKVRVYKAITLSILLYGCETWTIYKHHLRRLEAFNIRSLQSILGITWRERMPHTTILERTQSTSIEAMLITRQLRWVGHVIRMPEDRLPRCLLYGELEDGRRSVGGQKKRYKDSLKENLKACNIVPDQLEHLAINRSLWRSTVHEGVTYFEEQRTNARIAKRDARHARLQRPPLGPGDGIPCPTCGKRCASEFGLRSHQRSHRPRNGQD